MLQEVGDFAILLDNGYTGTRALALNLLSSLATLPGADRLLFPGGGHRYRAFYPCTVGSELNLYRDRPTWCLD